MRNFIFLFLIFLVLLTACAPQDTPQSAATPETIAPGEPSPDVGFCTADVQECPDGSFVSRVPPSCDFAPCPAQ